MAVRSYHSGNSNTRVLPSDAVSPTPTPYEAMERNELAHHIKEALSSLPHSHRQTLELVLDGLSANQIASTIGCTEKAVRRLLDKARAGVRNMLSHCGSAYALIQWRSDECPARKEKYNCVKWLYLQRLRAE